MAGYKQDTKLMAKNSAFMYIQMGIKMLIGLYTVRVILHALGAEDYGIYNVVGGFVSMFTFITSTLVSASQRFFAYAIGKGEYELLNRYFNSTIVCFIILSVALFFSIEAIGYWFVNCKMVVPDNRLAAANWVLQFSIVAFIVRVMAVPFKGLVVAGEKMIVFAIVSVLDSFMLLGVAYLLLSVKGDRLQVYALCMLAIAAISTLLYVVLCRHNFPKASEIRLRWEGGLLKELLSYCGWYMFGTMATVVRSQGINMLLNVFFNPVVNAARAIAYQINNAINQFVNSFYQAVRPQITKLTAAGENEKMLSLVFSSSVISYLLTCLIAVPLLVEMPFVLSFWLGDIPEYTVIFSRLVIITAMIDTLGLPLTTAVCATGNIRNFQLITGAILVLNLPVSYCLLRLYPHPYVAFYVSIAMSAAAQVIRMGIMKGMFGMSVCRYAQDVLLRVASVTALSLLFTGYASSRCGSNVWLHVAVVAASLPCVILLSWYMGFRKSQREFVVGLVRKRLHR